MPYKDPEAYRAYQRDYQRRYSRQNTEYRLKHNSKHRQWLDDNKRQQKLSYIRRRYGLNEQEYEDLLAAGCAICGATEDLQVDHDHSTGLVRAALCGHCNAGFGQFRESPDLLVRAAEYAKLWTTEDSRSESNFLPRCRRR
jgi:hypothetical protein